MMNDRVNTTTSLMAMLTIALAIALVGGLVVVPAIEQAHAANSISDARNKGKQGDLSSGGKRRGGGSDI
jgi:hypothetical protein